MVGRVEVNEEAARRLLRGSLHVYRQNIVKVEADNGEWVEVRHGGETLGYGFYSENSSIPVKIFGKNDEDPLEIVLGRMDYLYGEKRRLYGSTFRWVFAEGDLLPGLVVDLFRDVASLRIGVFGLERFKEEIADYLVGKGVESVVERNDFPSRLREGLPVRKGVLRGRRWRTTVEEGSVSLIVDALNGQKTGFYLDQRENRIFSEHFSDARRVLDVYSYTGGFGIHMGIGEAEVHFVEMGAGAVDLLQENMELNGVRGRIYRGDAMDTMERLVRKGERYDVVSLDPPALAKERDHLPSAKKAYFTINRLAMRLLSPGGVLLTSSCTQALTPKDFIGIVVGAARKEGRTLRVLGSLKGQAPDHTYYPPHPETRYLKHVVAVVE